MRSAQANHLAGLVVTGLGISRQAGGRDYSVHGLPLRRGVGASSGDEAAPTLRDGTYRTAECQ